MAKADNMLSILWLLKTGKQMTAKQLAEALEMHIRTVYRYIDALCASGVPIISDAGPGGGYKLLQPLDAAPLFFEQGEQLALIHAAQFAQEAGYPYGDALGRAVTKLKRYTNEQQLETLQRHETGLNVISPVPKRNLAEVLQQLENAVASCTTLQITYMKNYGSEPLARLLDPYGLIHWKNQWYVSGFCHLRQEIRSFRVDRITSLAATEQSFNRPAQFDARHDFLHHLLPDTSRQDDLTVVRLQGMPEAINDLCEHWQIAHGLKERSETELFTHIPAASLYTYLTHILLSYGRSIRIVEPVQLKEHMVELAAALALHHQD